MLREVYPAFNAICKEAKISRRTQPYINEEFNVHGLYTTALSNIRSVPARFINLVIEAINKFMHLPKYVIVILDWDLVDYAGLDDPEAAYHCIDEMMKYIIKEMNKYFDAQFEDMYQAKPGSIKKGEPRMIWMRMLQRPTIEYSFAQQFRLPFDEILERHLVIEGHSHIMELTSLVKDEYFDNAGKLLASGRIQFWKEFDQIIKD